MPTYDYRCENCEHELEVFQNISAPPKRKCPKCGKSKLRRKIGGGAGFLFKGSGFYLTDYRSDSYRKGAEADQKPSDASAAKDAPAAPAEKKEQKTPSPDKPKEKSKEKKSKGKESAA